MGKNDAWTKEDHDTLIEIKTIVGVLRTDLGNHLVSMIAEIAKLDARIKPIEDRNMRVNADVLVQKYDGMYDEWNRHKERLNVQRGYVLAAATISSIIFTQGIRYVFEHVIK
jgi:hypothetical protein